MGPRYSGNKFVLNVVLVILLIIIGLLLTALYVITKPNPIAFGASFIPVLVGGGILLFDTLRKNKKKQK